MRVTASRSALLSRCGYWAQDGIAWVESRSEAATRGTMLHAACESFIGSGQCVEPEGLTGDDASTWAHARAWIVANMTETWGEEVPIAYDLASDTARLMKSEGARDYSDLRAGEMAGTLDVMAADSGGQRAVVYDFKFTSYSAGASDQLGTLGLFAARYLGVDEARVVAVYITPEGVREVPRDLDMFHLSAIAVSLRERLDAIPSAKPEPGAHCRELYCPARMSCPATSTAMAQVIPAESIARFRMALVPESPEHAAWMLPRLKLAEEWLDTAKANVKDMARNLGELPLGDGKVWREVDSKRTTASAAKLEDLARRMGATEEQIKACFNEITVKQFRETKAKAKGRAA